MTTWRLVDGRDPVDCPDDFPTKLISSDVDLRQELDRLRSLEPAIVSLTSATGEAVQIGIGGPFAGVRWYPSPNASPQCRELLANHTYCPGRIDFRAEGDSITFWPEHLMPADQVIDIVIYFFKFQRLPDWVAWKEWDSARSQWNVRSAVKVRSA